MPTVAYHTLGCKVNQYDTQAMEELLSAAGYPTVPFPGPADVLSLILSDQYLHRHRHRR